MIFGLFKKTKQPKRYALAIWINEKFDPLGGGADRYPSIRKAERAIPEVNRRRASQNLNLQPVSAILEMPSGKVVRCIPPE